MQWTVPDVYHHSLAAIEHSQFGMKSLLAINEFVLWYF